MQIWFRRKIFPLVFWMKILSTYAPSLIQLSILSFMEKYCILSVKSRHYVLQYSNTLWFIQILQFG